MLVKARSEFIVSTTDSALILKSNVFNVSATKPAGVEAKRHNSGVTIGAAFLSENPLTL